MAAPGTRDLETTAGDEYAHVLTFEDGAGVPINLASPARTFTAQVRPYPGAPDAAGFETFTIDVTQAATGILTIRLTEAQTLARVGMGWWELQQVIAGVTTTLLRGKFVVAKQVTTI